MAWIGQSGLYPPTIDTFMPAFVLRADAKCKVYFSISPYNSIEDIKSVQVTVSNQYTNQSVLKTEKYPAEIKITNYKIDNSINTDYKYYIEISNDDLKDGFQINNFYKVQLRFSRLDKIPDQQVTMAYIFNNLSSFSEWSSVCLIRAISQPIFSSEAFGDYESNSMYYLTEISQLIEFNGNLSFANQNETDYLYSYKIKVLEQETNKIVEESEEEFPINNNTNFINYVFKYDFKNDYNYTIFLNYITANNYQEEITYSFYINKKYNEKENDGLLKIINVENRYDKGLIEITIKNENNYNSFYTIRRASSENNYEIWEDLYTGQIEALQNQIIFKDVTVQAGVLYQYGIQRRDATGNRDTLYKYINKENLPISTMADFEHAFLVGNNKSLCLKFDLDISSLKTNISESKVETIGSKYPYIRRSSQIEYKEFPISGTISSFIDNYESISNEGKMIQENLFTSKNELYINKDIAEEYKQYNNNNSISNYYDYFLEKEFREKVSDFLLENNVKLFKSLTEGNILIKLMDISLTPKKELSRMIYDFSATAIEIGESSLDNLKLYNTYQSIADNIEFQIESKIIEEEMIYGQFIKTIDENFSQDDNWIDLIKEDYTKKHSSSETYSKVLEDIFYVECFQIGEIHHSTYIKTIQRIYIDEDGTVFYDNQIDSNYIKYANKDGIKYLNTDNNYLTNNFDLIINYVGKSVTYKKNINIKSKQYYIDIRQINQGQEYKTINSDTDVYNLINNHIQLRNSNKIKYSLVDLNGVHIMADKYAYALFSIKLENEDEERLYQTSISVNNNIHEIKIFENNKIERITYKGILAFTQAPPYSYSNAIVYTNSNSGLEEPIYYYSLSDIVNPREKDYYQLYKNGLDSPDIYIEDGVLILNDSSFIEQNEHGEGDPNVDYYKLILNGVPPEEEENRWIYLNNNFYFLEVIQSRDIGQEEICLIHMPLDVYINYIYKGERREYL